MSHILAWCERIRPIFLSRGQIGFDSRLPDSLGYASELLYPLGEGFKLGLGDSVAGTKKRLQRGRFGRRIHDLDWGF